MRIFLGLMLLLGTGIAPAAAEVQARAPMAARELLTVEGLLSKFDTEKRMIWIETDDETRMQFSYDANTPLVGASKLSVGDALKVFYEVEGDINRAMRVYACRDPRDSSRSSPTC